MRESLIPHCESSDQSDQGGLSPLLTVLVRDGFVYYAVMLGTLDDAISFVSIAKQSFSARSVQSHHVLCSVPKPSWNNAVYRHASEL